MRSDWRDRAACRDVDPDLFFPVGTSGPAQEQTKRAKALCVRCQVTDDCLTFALLALPEGIAGGMTAAERARTRGDRSRHRPVLSGTGTALDRRETAARLRGRGWSASAIADQLGVNERTVYRLLRGAA